MLLMTGPGDPLGILHGVDVGNQKGKEKRFVSLSFRVGRPHNSRSSRSRGSYVYNS